MTTSAQSLKKGEIVYFDGFYADIGETWEFYVKTKEGHKLLINNHCVEFTTKIPDIVALQPIEETKLMKWNLISTAMIIALRYKKRTN